MDSKIFESKYKITSDGVVISLKTGRPLRQYVFGGYKIVGLFLNGKKSSYFVHRLVGKMFIANPDNLGYINHKDGNKFNNNYLNLEWCTSGYNQIHAYESNLKKMPKGELNGRSVLQEENVLSLYNEALKGASGVYLSNKYKVSTTCVIDIKNKKSWNYLLKDLPDIPIKNKRESIPENIVILVAEKLQEGLSILDIKDKIAPQYLLTEIQIRSIRKRRSYRKLTENFTW